jgi:predicted RNase H-like nuclease
LSKTRPNTTLVGVDGCHGGWLAVISTARGPVEAHVFDSFAEVIAGVNSTARFGVDIPMGLREVGVRACELEARRRLQRPRKSSVFPAPPKECLSAQSYEQACQICYRVEGKKMSRQAYGILPKIREVEHYLARHAAARRRIAEVHPEVSFATWQGGSGLAHSKKTAEGKLERRALIEQLWPDTVDRLRVALRGHDYLLDDLHDAFAALWSTRRWLRGEGEFLGADPKIHRSARQLGILV